MQTHYAQRHQVAGAGFTRVSAPAFPVCAMGTPSWSNGNSLDISTGKPGSPPAALGVPVVAPATARLRTGRRGNPAAFLFCPPTTVHRPTAADRQHDDTHPRPQENGDVRPTRPPDGDR